ncbi:MAG: DUF1127 domain-containing protein [Parvibaculaceae bacterium]
MSSTTGFSLRQSHSPLAIHVFRRAFAGLAARVRRLRTVNELEQLSDRQLRDIGVERREIEAIAEREIARLRAR